MSRFGSSTARVLLLLLVCPLVSYGQTELKRPRIGIALSGGGALGLAHLGVLRYLEDQHIPLDAIAGTSIGGLIGGLYATGRSSSDLEKLVNSADWDNLLRTSSRYEDRSITEKQGWNRISGVYSIPLRNGLTLPGGINNGQALVRLLSGETSEYWDVEDFDDLPIPFRCVATNLLTGEPVVLKSGHLVEALRATMAIPGIFTPLERGGQILVDGGLVNNLPVDVAREMGVDVVLAVTLRVAGPPPETLRELPSVVRQTMSVAVRQTELDQEKLADLNIAVDLPNRGLMDFSDPQLFINAGYQAASLQQPALEKFSLLPEEWAAYLQARQAKEKTAADRGTLTRVVTTDPSLERNATRELTRKIGTGVDKPQLEGVLSGFTAATALPHAFYGWHSSADQAGYEIKLDPRSATEIFVTPSLFHQVSRGEPIRTSFRLSGSAILKDAYKSRILGDGSIGRDPHFFLEYYHPFNGSAYFISPGFSVEREHFSEFTDSGRSGHRRVRISGSLFFGVGTWRQLQLRIGARAGADRYSDPGPSGGIATENTRFFNPEVQGTINTQDSGILPTKGFRLNASAGWSRRNVSYPYLQMNFDHFQPLGHQTSIFGIGHTDTSFGKQLGFYDQFTAGGLNDLDAYRYQEIRGDTLLIGGGGLLYRGLNPKDADFRPIFASWYQVGGVNPGTDRSITQQSATAGVLVPTPLGLAAGTVNFDLKGSVRFRFSLGSFWNRP